ncbi:hypothetical protein [Desulfogranum marinum]|uniref:hypothetical protein n=1 Tax=Desulfogranum marinum TaxID=453220 RepID=UPI0029C6668B|nr:hypothetical protein [Desulfogranum marinum]
MAKQKRPKANYNPTPKKQPKSLNLPNYNSANPSWRFSKLELADPFGWHTIDTDLLHRIREQLQAFESMTWNEILVVGKKHHHSIPVYKLCAEAQKRLHALKLDDIETLISLKMTGVERIWGIRQQSSLLLLWWDPSHQICPSKKKHT